MTFSGTLISTVYDPNTNLFSVAIDGNIHSLLTSSNYSSVSWAERLALSSPLAKWLHAFYSSHAKPEPVALENIHARCGLRAPLKEFKRSVKAALGELAEHTAMSGDIDAKGRLVMRRSCLSRTQLKAVAAAPARKGKKARQKASPEVGTDELVF